MKIPSVVAGPIARNMLRAFGFWTIPPLALAPDAVEQLAAGVGEAVDRGSGMQLVMPSGVSAMETLRWLAATRPVLFHGSGREDLEQLLPVRQSSDTSEFGNQRAVFATQDPVWATFFAVLDRSNPDFCATRNGTSTVVGRNGSFGPRYFFSVNTDALGPRLWRAGTVYVLDPEGFVSDERDLGVIDNAQWASVAPVRFLAKISVTPADFPFTNATFGHRTGESELRTFARLRRAAR